MSLVDWLGEGERFLLYPLLFAISSLYLLTSEGCTLYSHNMFLEVLVSCLAGPDEFILWQAQQTLVMFRNPIVIDHCQFKHFAQMISWITFHLLFG
jgi:hypothetical protein